MTKSLRITISVLCLFAFAASLIAAGMPKIAEHQRITFNKPMLLGNTELPAGTYNVLHQMQGTDHYMLFQQTDVRKDKAVEVKVKCNLVPLDGKAKRSETKYMQNAKNQNVLVELTFQGDEAKHVLE